MRLRSKEKKLRPNGKTEARNKNECEREIEIHSAVSSAGTALGWNVD